MKKNDNYKWIIGFIIGVLLAIPLVYAVTKYASSEVLYDNTSSSLTSADVQGAIDELANKYNGVFTCPTGKTCLDKPPVKLGDYVSMTPTLTSVTTSTAKTGYTSSQTINPQELNLWRVIKLNDDGTIDIISEYVSSTAIYFKGTTGYKNSVGVLNELASKYENSTYTAGSRYFGYNGQTEYISILSIIGCGINSTKIACSVSTSSSNANESSGRGDVLYKTDYNLVENALGTLKTTNPSGEERGYWVASRYYNYNKSYNSYSSNNYSYYYNYYLRRTPSNDTLERSVLYYFRYSNSSSSPTTKISAFSNHLRPILTLKPRVKYTGSGTKDSPWQLSI